MLTNLNLVNSYFICNLYKVRLIWVVHTATFSKRQTRQITE